MFDMTSITQQAAAAQESTLGSIENFAEQADAFRNMFGVAQVQGDWTGAEMALESLLQIVYAQAVMLNPGAPLAMPKPARVYEDVIA